MASKVLIAHNSAALTLAMSLSPSLHCSTRFGLILLRSSVSCFSCLDQLIEIRSNSIKPNCLSFAFSIDCVTWRFLGATVVVKAVRPRIAAKMIVARGGWLWLRWDILHLSPLSCFDLPLPNLICCLAVRPMAGHQEEKAPWPASSARAVS